MKARLVHKTYEVPNYKSLRVVEVVAEKVSFIQTKPIERQKLKELSTEDQDLIEVLL